MPVRIIPGTGADGADFQPRDAVAADIERLIEGLQAGAAAHGIVVQRFEQAIKDIAPQLRTFRIDIEQRPQATTLTLIVHHGGAHTHEEIRNQYAHDAWIGERYYPVTVEIAPDREDQPGL